jgi:hypothetical protein
MMNLNHKIWRLIPIIVLGLYFNFKLIRDADNTFPFDDIIQIIILCIFSFSMILVIYKDRNEYMNNHLNSSFLPTLAGLLFILSFFVTDYFLKARDNSPVILNAIYNGDYNGCSFEFRKNGSYKFGECSIGCTYYRGSYAINDSIITIDKSKIETSIVSNMLLIRQIRMDDSTMGKKIYQVDAGHQIIDRATVFTVFEDKSVNTSSN